MLAATRKIDDTKNTRRIGLLLTTRYIYIPIARVIQS